MRLPSWLRTRTTRRVGRTVVVTLDLDTTRLDDAMLDVRESTSKTRLRLRIAAERRAGLAFVQQLLDDMAADVGLAGSTGPTRCAQPPDLQCPSSTGGCPCGKAVAAELIEGNAP